MQRKPFLRLLFIFALAICAGYIILPSNPGLHIDWLNIHHPLQVRQGLDLQGGVRVLLVPEPAQYYSTEVLNAEIGATRDQIEQRVNGGLGVNEPSIRIQTSNGRPSIAVELPKLQGDNQEEAINTLLKAGNLEFWNTGPAPSGIVPAGTEFDPAHYAEYNPGSKAPFTGKDLDSKQIGVGINEQTGRPPDQLCDEGGRGNTFCHLHAGECWQHFNCDA